MKKRPPAWLRKYFEQETINLHEFTMICCGWDPAGPIVNQALYDERLETITRAVASGELPTVRPGDR